MKTFTIYNRLYNVDLIVVINCSFVDMKKFLLKKKDIDFKVSADSLNSAAGSYYSIDHTEKLIYIPKLGRDPISISNLVHELFHHVTEVFHERGVPIKAYSEGNRADEAAAYLLGFYTREALKAIK